MDQISRLLWLLVMMAALTALSTDIYLPSLTELEGYFQTTTAAITQTVTVFIAAFAVGQLVFGPLSDRYGRRNPLIVGLVLYIAANVLCALAQSVEMLLLSRCLQGLGACSGFVSCTAIVRDLFQGQDRTRAMARVATAVALAPILAPILGSWLYLTLGWRWIFVFLAGFGALLLLGVLRKLPETRPVALRGPSTSGYIIVLSNPHFRRWALACGLGFAALYAFIGNSSHILMTHFGQSTKVYGFLFASNALAYMAGSWLASKASSRLSNRQLVLWGVLHILCGGLLMLLLSGSGTFMGVLGPMYLVTSGVALLSPASMAAALEPFEGQAAAASALIGFVRFALAALVLMGSSSMEGHPVVVLGGTVTLCALLSLMVLHLSDGSGRAPVLDGAEAGAMVQTVNLT